MNKFIAILIIIAAITIIPDYIQSINQAVQQYPQCRFANDPITCAVILENRQKEN